MESIYTVQQETFEGESFHEFRGFRAISESFLLQKLTATPTCN